MRLLSRLFRWRAPAPIDVTGPATLYPHHGGAYRDRTAGEGQGEHPHRPSGRAAVSSLRPGDEHLRHHDGSHRWSGGPADDRGRAAYQVALRVHMEAHRAEGCDEVYVGRPTRVV